jgi:CO/xanthine dehydrogenase Mo-binding subunit
MTRYFGMAGGELIAHGEVRPEAGRGTFAAGPVFWEVGVAAAEVHVDPDTGVVRVHRVFTVADVGRAINPLLVERQDQGATLQGLGNALFEEILFEDGRLMNGSLLQYRVPSTLDVPDEMGSLLVEHADGPGPDGAKGCGEGGLAAVVAAIATAVADAGVPVDELPLTPERVWRSMSAARRTTTSDSDFRGPGS